MPSRINPKRLTFSCQSHFLNFLRYPKIPHQRESTDSTRTYGHFNTLSTQFPGPHQPLLSAGCRPKTPESQTRVTGHSFIFSQGCHLGPLLLTLLYALKLFTTGVLCISGQCHRVYTFQSQQLHLHNAFEDRF